MFNYKKVITMSDREKIEKATYLRRMYEEKLAHVNPKKSFKDRVNEAIADMDKKFGSQWRDMLDESGLDIMPSSEPEQESTKSGPEKVDMFSKLQDEADEEGIGEPPLSFQGPEKKQELPLIVIVEKRLGDVKRKRATIRKD